jgi:hypothetical protein
MFLRESRHLQAPLIGRSLRGRATAPPGAGHRDQGVELLE